VRVIVDGTPVTVAADSSLLDATRAAGAEVPSLCADPRLAPYGSCRTCMVSIEGTDGPVPACTTPAAEGGVVRTDDPVALRTARLALELIVGQLPVSALDQPPERSELVRAGTHDAAGGEDTVRALLRLPVARRPTALFCANNRNTVGALRALRDHPRPIAIVGFDDFELADMLATPVTVVRHVPEDMGRITAELAYARLDGDTGPPERRTIPCELVPRGSGEVTT